MTTHSPTELQALKGQLRAQARARRADQADKDELSRLIWEQLIAQPEYVAAGTLMVYLNLPGEVRTQPYLPVITEQGKQIVIPYCLGNELELFRLGSPSELETGMLGIPEPRSELRLLAEKRVEVSRVDLIIVPGVAFDRQGARIGRGKGYYDRLLRRARPDAPAIGLAFECQLFPILPMLPHDVHVDKVITDKAVYRGKGRARGTPP